MVERSACKDSRHACRYAEEDQPAATLQPIRRGDPAARSKKQCLDCPRAPRSAHQQNEQEQEQARHLGKRQTLSGQKACSGQNHGASTCVFLGKNALPIEVMTGRRIEADFRDAEGEDNASQRESRHRHG